VIKKSVLSELKMTKHRLENEPPSLQTDHQHSNYSASAYHKSSPISLESIKSLMPTLTLKLSGLELINLAMLCNQQRRYELALPLLDSAVRLFDHTDPTQAAILRVHASRTRLALGYWDSAWETFTVMVDHLHDLPDIRIQVLLNLGWMALQRGQFPLAALKLRALEDLACTNTQSAEIDVLRQAIHITSDHDGTLAICTCSTWMPREDSFGLSLDLAIGDIGEPWLYLEGWLFDPFEQLRALLLIHDDSLTRLDKHQLVYFSRPDLNDLFSQHGFDCHQKAGFRLALHRETLSGAHAICHDQPTLWLIAIRDNQPPLIITRPLTQTNSQTPSLYSLVYEALDSNLDTVYDTRSSWSYPVGC